MAGIVILVIFLIVGIGYRIMRTKLRRTMYRAKETALQGTGLSHAELSSSISGAITDNFIESFIKDYPSFTKDSLLAYIKMLSDGIINKTIRNEYTESLIAKMQSDTNLEKYSTMNFRYTQVIYYVNNAVKFKAVYDDTRDEHIIELDGYIENSQLKINNYRLIKGNVIGL